MKQQKALTLSIVIPVYNEQDHLKNCLDSISNQTDKPDEVIVIDNNSTDYSRAIAESYPFVRVIAEKKHGIAYARDRGFNSAQASLIGRIDADTILPSDWVAKVKHFYGDSGRGDSALTGGGYFYNIRAPRFNGWLQSQLAFRVNRFITGFYILWGSNMVLPRSLWLAVKSDVCYRTDIHEDMDLAIHLHRLGYKVVYMENLRVGVYLKRMWEHRKEQRVYISRWPRTLKIHGYKNWWLGWLGNVFIVYIMQPIAVIAEMLGRLMGRRLKYNRHID